MQSYSEAEVLYTYNAPFFLLTLDPTHGPADGNTRVTVTVGLTDANDTVPYQFVRGSDDVRCRFGAVVVPAVEVYNTSVVCPSSKSLDPAGGVAAVDVSVNGGADFTTDGLTYTYETGTVSHIISPSFGPTTGGTLVTVSGLGIPNVPTSQAMCLFGGIAMQAVANGDGYVTCRSPAVPAPSVVAVEVTVNGPDFFPQYGLQYHFEAPLVVTAVMPTQGPVEGGTPVAVTGSNFRNETPGMLRCRFGDQESPAKYMSASLVGCTSPPLRSVDEVQTVSLFSLAHVPEVQTVTLAAADYVQEEFTIRTFSQTVMQPEIQVVETYVGDVDEIQTISAGTRLS